MRFHTSGNVNLNLSQKEVKELILALEGDEFQRAYWLEMLRELTDDANRNTRMIELTQEFLDKHARRTKCYLISDAYPNHSKEERISDWVHYQMEYTSGIIWDEKTKIAVINKYSSPTLLDKEVELELLDYVTKWLQGESSQQGAGHSEATKGSIPFDSTKEKS